MVDSVRGSPLKESRSQMSHKGQTSSSNIEDDSENSGSSNESTSQVGSGSGDSKLKYMSKEGGGASNFGGHHHPHMLGMKDRNHKRKKHLRRTAAEIEREFIVSYSQNDVIHFQCPYAECGKFYGSEGSLNLHIKIKHNGGNKTEREKLAVRYCQVIHTHYRSKQCRLLSMDLSKERLRLWTLTCHLGPYRKLSRRQD